MVLEGINRRVRKESRTHMESATFETLDNTKAFSVAILLLLENRKNVTILDLASKTKYSKIIAGSTFEKRLSPLNK